MLPVQPVIPRNDMIRCVLCAHPPCDSVCEKMKPAELLRSVWFRNEQGAAGRLPAENPCLICPAPCERACVRAGEVPIRDLMNQLYYQVKPECETAIPEDASRLQSVHIKKEPSPVKEKTLSGYFIPGCRRSALLHQSSLRYMASPKLKKR